MNETEPRAADTEPVLPPRSRDLLAGYSEWAEDHYPMRAGWNTATEILLRQAWMAGVEAERARCVAAVEGERLDDPTDNADDIAYDNAVRDCIAAIRKGPQP